MNPYINGSYDPKKTATFSSKKITKKWKKHIRQSDNNSHESLMEENVITNMPSGLQMSN
jgi:hypothetical protein